MPVAFEPPDQAEVIQLIAELDAYQDSLYPPESRHILDLDALKEPNVLFAVARNAAGHAIGCGAIVIGREYGEVKRMYVHPHSRGQGLARQVLVLLEAKAAELHCMTLMLETGPRQPEALAFYASLGYARRPPYGDYWDDPNSVFMAKQIKVQHVHRQP